jgi:predicted histidine transporter YuiF (NhaC family)
MLVEANHDARTVHNICAGISTWLLLAAFMIIPGTFTSLRDSSLFRNVSQADNTALVKDILNSVSHVGLFWVAGFFYFIGLSGCISLWRVWRHNYVWLMNNIFR